MVQNTKQDWVIFPMYKKCKEKKKTFFFHSNLTLTCLVNVKKIYESKNILMYQNRNSLSFNLCLLGQMEYGWTLFWKSLHAEKWYFVTKIVLTYSEKKLFKWSRTTFEIRGWRPRMWKMFEITWTIYSKSERSEQFLETVWNHSSITSSCFWLF